MIDMGQADRTLRHTPSGDDGVFDMHRERMRGMKMKTSELQGAALDWAVAKCEGHDMEFFQVVDAFMPSTDWSQGGPIIEREGVSMRFSPKDARGAWYAVLGKNRFLSPDFEGSGPTPLIAAMRCYVASKLGDEVEVPDEIVS